MGLILRTSNRGSKKEDTVYDFEIWYNSITKNIKNTCAKKSKNNSTTNPGAIWEALASLPPCEKPTWPDSTSRHGIFSLSRLHGPLDHPVWRGVLHRGRTAFGRRIAWDPHLRGASGSMALWILLSDSGQGLRLDEVFFKGRLEAVNY